MFSFKNYFNSKYCKNELKYALRREKNIICVVIEEGVELTPGFDMQLNSEQFIFMHRFSTASEFLDKLKGSLPSKIFGDEGITVCKVKQKRIYLKKKIVGNGDYEYYTLLMQDKENRENIKTLVSNAIHTEMFYYYDNINITSDLTPNLYGIRSGLYGHNSNDYYSTINREFYITTRAMNLNIFRWRYDLYKLNIISNLSKDDEQKTIEDNHKVKIDLIKTVNSLRIIDFDHNKNYAVVTQLKKYQFPDEYENLPFENMKEVNSSDGAKNFYIVKNFNIEKTLFNI